MPFVYEHPVYWQKVQEETKGSGDFERSTCLFIDSEKARPHTEEEMIKVERIQGKLILVAAEDHHAIADIDSNVRRANGVCFISPSTFTSIESHL